MLKRYTIYGVAQDKEPPPFEKLAIVLSYADTLEQARDLARERKSAEPNYYVGVFDWEIGDYVGAFQRLGAK